MNSGVLIRLVLVLAWLALFVPHVVRHAAPGLGISKRNDFASVMAANLGREYLYDLQRDAGPRSRKLGQVRLAFIRVDDGFELETWLRIDDLGLLAPGLALLPQFSEQTSREMTLLMVEQLDAGLRLAGVRANGNAFGLEVAADGTVGAAGLSGTYTVGEGVPTPYTLPEITADAGQGSDLAINLPPGLETGDRFTTRLLSPDFARLRLAASTAVFLVQARESLITSGGRRNLLRVEMQVDARPVSTLWCDTNGTVYRSRQHQGGMVLELTQIRMAGGDILWPPQQATGP
jgi:hypothetical protein